MAKLSRLGYVVREALPKKEEIFWLKDDFIHYNDTSRTGHRPAIDQQQAGER
jgi:hypothetical protein